MQKRRKVVCPECRSVDTGVMTVTPGRVCFGCHSCLKIWTVDRQKVSECKQVFLTGRY